MNKWKINVKVIYVNVGSVTSQYNGKPTKSFDNILHNSENYGTQENLKTSLEPLNNLTHYGTYFT